MKTVSTRLDSEIKSRFHDKAKSQGLTSSDCLRRLIYSFLEVGFPEMPDLRRLDGVDERISGLEGKLAGIEGIGSKIERLESSIIGLLGLFCRTNRDDEKFCRIMAPQERPSIDGISALGRLFVKDGLELEVESPF